MAPLLNLIKSLISWISQLDTQEYGIFIDTFTECFLDALNAYYNEDYVMLGELSAEIEKTLLEWAK